MIMIMHYECEDCRGINSFEAPAAKYISTEKTCEHCGKTQIVEGFVDIDESEEKEA